MTALLTWVCLDSPERTEDIKALIRSLLLDNVTQQIEDPHQKKAYKYALRLIHDYISARSQYRGRPPIH